MPDLGMELHAIEFAFGVLKRSHWAGTRRCQNIEILGKFCGKFVERRNNSLCHKERFKCKLKKAYSFAKKACLAEFPAIAKKKNPKNKKPKKFK